jgi:hypothetical protein
MELVLSAISSGGLAGAGNQYMCLLIISVATRLGLIGLAPQVRFMESWWFIAVVALFWLLTVLPAYGSLLSPGVLNAVNTIVNFLSGFMVPASASLLTLASVGVIAEMHPDLYDFLRTLQIFDPSGQGIGKIGWLMAGGGALTAATLTGAKFLAKPVLSTATGTAGTVSAPTYATVENVASVVLMTLSYVLTQVSPWLLVGLLALVTLTIVGLMAWSIYQLWRLRKGIGKVIRLIETHPEAGLSVVAEFLVWGLGWLIWENWTPGVVRLALWGLWMVTIFVAIPAIGTALAAVPFIASAFVLVAETATVMAGLYAGSRSARSLMKTFGQVGEPIPGTAPASLPSSSG